MNAALPSDFRAALHAALDLEFARTIAARRGATSPPEKETAGRVVKPAGGKGAPEYPLLRRWPTAAPWSTPDP